MLLESCLLFHLPVPANYLLACAQIRRLGLTVKVWIFTIR